MTTKHTPGPWGTMKMSGNRGIEIRSSKSMHPVATILPHYKYAASHEANARLIAAAPELMTQIGHCVRFLADLNGSDWIKGDDAGSVDMRQRAKALQKTAFDAIAKAEGRAS